ncbi:MAG: glycosyltransferase [Thermodesulfobacteriota bacterium]
MEKLRVLQLTERLDVGGLEQVIATIATGLDRNRYDSGVWALAGGGAMADRIRERGCPVRILRCDTYHGVRPILALARQLRQAAPHIVHTHGYFAGTAGRIAAKIAGVPVLVHHVHSTNSQYRRRNLLMERGLGRITAAVLCCSAAVAAFVREREGIAAARTQVLPNGIAPPPAPVAQEEFLADFGLAADDQVVFCVASLQPHKGQAALLRATAAVAGRHPRLRLVLIGAGPLDGDLQRLARQLGLGGRVVFAGLRTDVRRLLPHGCCLVLPSTVREGMGIAVIEAMAAGLAAIGSRLGGIPEVIEENGSGLLCEPGDVPGLAAALDRLLGDGRLRRRFGDRGRELYRQRFTDDAMLAQLTSCYEHHVAAARR